MPIVSITRLLRFNAAHRVYNPAFSDEQNQRVFGKCNNPNWHGHNYTLEITVEGEVDPETGSSWTSPSSSGSPSASSWTGWTTRT
jgi:6-pyruvoyltetrahydropterin/6-carboxytetrahydropterin synthase